MPFLINPPIISSDKPQAFFFSFIGVRARRACCGFAPLLSWNRWKRSNSAAAAFWNLLFGYRCALCTRFRTYCEINALPSALRESLTALNADMVEVYVGSGLLRISISKAGHLALVRKRQPQSPISLPTNYATKNLGLDSSDSRTPSWKAFGTPFLPLGSRLCTLKRTQIQLSQIPELRLGQKFADRKAEHVSRFVSDSIQKSISRWTLPDSILRASFSSMAFTISLASSATYFLKAQ